LRANDCRAARRKFFALADIAGNMRDGKPAHDTPPIALETVKRIDAILGIEREINGKSAEIRFAVRQDRSRPLVESLRCWPLNERAKAIDDFTILKHGRWAAFIEFLDDGRICLTNNAAERALRGIALGRKSWLFAGSDRGGDRAAFMDTLIVTAKINDIDPQAWMADALARLPSMTVSRVQEPLPWNWRTEAEAVKAAQPRHSADAYGETRASANETAGSPPNPMSRVLPLKA
jgi:transposase